MDVIKKKHWWQSDALKWSVLGLLGLLVGYLVVLMYAQGEYLFAITTLILSSAGLYIFANRKAYAWRYVYPGMAGMGLFVLFPLVCTIAIAFTNYSSTNQLTFERAQEVLLDRSWQAGKTYNFGLYPAGDEWQLALSDGETGKITSPTRLNLAASKTATERNDRPARRRTRESARDYPESSGAE